MSADSRNPLRDPKVREALSLALNRDGIASNVMSGMAVPAAAMAGEGMFGVDPRSLCLFFALKSRKFQLCRVAFDAQLL